MGARSARGPRHPGGRADDAALLDAWARAHAEELYRFAYRACGSNDTAEDLVQETFHEAWKHHGPLVEIREPRAWLFLILRRRYARLRRSEQRRPWFVVFEAAGLGAAGCARGPTGEGADTTDELQHTLDGMDDRLKMPLLMVFMQGMTCAQAAEQLDIPLGTVLSRINRAKKQVREVMRDRASAGEPDTSPGIVDGRPCLRIGGAP